MLQNLIIVSEQVAILFVLIAVGFVCSKTKLINDAGAKHLTDIALYLATPCIMVQSFQDVKFEESLALNLGICAICSVLIQVVSIFICRPIFRDKNESRKRVLRFAAVFSNCGFMSLPLQKELLGEDGWFFGSIFVAVFNIVVWTYGLFDMSGDKKQLSIKRLAFNPSLSRLSDISRRSTRPSRCSSSDTIFPKPTFRVISRIRLSMLCCCSGLSVFRLRRCLLCARAEFREKSSSPA